MSASHYLPIALGLLLLAGCGNQGKTPLQSAAEEEEQVAPSPSSPPMEEPKATQSTDSYELPEWERPFQWDAQQIEKRHVELAMAPLPDYVSKVRGAGGKSKEGDILSDWAFVVPDEHISDFQDYLKELGVPEEYLTADSPFRVSDRENWTAPQPPADRLNFLMAETCPGEGTLMGLDFVAGQSRSYRFENPNLESSELRIYFDAITGNTYVQERYIGW